MALPLKDTQGSKVLGVKMTVGAEAANVINVACVAEWVAKEPVGRRVGLLWYLSTDANGDNLVATAPTGGIAIGTNGVLVEAIADKAGFLISESNGKFDVSLTDTGTPTFYFVVVLPTGDLVVSGAITFA